MIEVYKINDEKRPNMDYCIELNDGKHYFTVYAMFELLKKIEDRLLKDSRGKGE